MPKKLSFRFVIGKPFRISSHPKKIMQFQHKNEGIKKAIKKLFDEFIILTSIPGLLQIINNPRILTKLLWIVALACGIFLTVFQSKTLYDDYYKRKTIQVQDWTFPHFVEFPAVTVCTHNPFIDWIKVTKENHQIVNNTMRAIDEYKDFEDADIFIERVLMNEMNNIGEYERYRLGIPLESFVIVCSWDNVNCTNSQLFQFNNLYYGNCFTFNHGMNDTPPLIGTTLSVLNLILKINFAAQFPYIFRDDGVAVFIHSAKTAPVLQLDSTTIIFPGYSAQFLVSQKKIERLAYPFPSRCVNASLPESQMKAGYYYSPNRPYSYSSEACMRSCIQRKNIESCLCIIETKTPFDNLFDDSISLQNVSVCLKGECENVSIIDEIKTCDCPFPCEEIVFEYMYYSSRDWLKNAVWQDFVDRVSTFNGKDIVMAEILFKTSYVEEIKEAAFISPTEFIANIGGNIGLAIGVSLLSIFEVSPKRSRAALQDSFQ